MKPRCVLVSISSLTPRPPRFAPAPRNTLRLKRLNRTLAAPRQHAQLGGHSDPRRGLTLQNNHVFGLGMGRRLAALASDRMLRTINQIDRMKLSATAPKISDATAG